jgi:hypothetical protein
LENIEEIDKFLDTYNHPKRNQKDINHLSRSITSNEIEAAVKRIPDGFSAEFYQTFNGELIPTLLKLFHEIEREGNCSTHSMKPVLHSSQNQTGTHQKG